MEFRKTTDRDGYEVLIDGKTLGFISKAGFLVSGVSANFVYVDAPALQELADTVKMVTCRHLDAKWDLEDLDEDTRKNGQELVRTCPNCGATIAID